MVLTLNGTTYRPGGEGLQKAFEQVNQGLALSPIKVTTLQDNLDQLIRVSCAITFNILMYVAIEEKKLALLLLF